MYRYRWKRSLPFLAVWRIHRFVVLVQWTSDHLKSSQRRFWLIHRILLSCLAVELSDQYTMIWDVIVWRCFGNCFQFCHVFHRFILIQKFSVFRFQLRVLWQTPFKSEKSVESHCMWVAWGIRGLLKWYSDYECFLVIFCTKCSSHCLSAIERGFFSCFDFISIVCVPGHSNVLGN